jgi:hypothetical protein
MGKLSIPGAATLVAVVDEVGGNERTRITMKDVAVVAYGPPAGNKGTEVIVILEYTPELPSGGSGAYPFLRPGLRGFPTERFGPPGF